MLEIRLLGNFSIHKEGNDLLLSSRPSKLLFSYLVLHPGVSTPREKLIQTLWPDISEIDSQSTFRQALRQLRSLVNKDLSTGEDYILITDDSIAFNQRAAHWVDAAQIARPLQPDSPAEVILNDLANYGGELLPGFDEPWVVIERERFNATFEQKTSLLLALLIRRERWSTVLEWGERWIALGRSPEPAYRALMLAYAAKGDSQQLVHAYQRCLDEVKKAGRKEPSPETRSTFERLLQGGELADLPDNIFPLNVIYATGSPFAPPKPAVAVEAPALHAVQEQLAIGTLLHDRYRLDAELGKGGMGVVYQGHDTLLGRDVAIKILERAFRQTDTYQRFISEAQTIAQINHPNIVAVYDAGEYEGSPYIVMELLQGESPTTQPPRPVSQVLDITMQVCDALHLVHSRGIIHRDIKPENVIILPGGQVKLMDFGLAHDQASRLTQAGAIIGTVFYLSPEQALGKEIDVRADIYAVGVMLYELTTGRLPFTGETILSVITQHLYATPAPPSSLNPALPPALNDLILRMLNKAPEDRPSDVAQVIQDLKEIKAQISTEQAASHPPFSARANGNLIAGAEQPKTGVYLLMERWRNQGLQVLDVASLALVHGSPGELVFDEPDTLLLARSALHRQVDIGPWLRRAASQDIAISVCEKLIAEYPKPNLRMAIVQAMENMPDQLATQSLHKLADSDDSPLVRSAAALAVARRGLGEEIACGLLKAYRENDDFAALTALVNLIDELGIPANLDYPKLPVTSLLFQKRLRANRNDILRQGWQTAVGAGILCFLNGLAAPFYIALSYPLDFQETLKFITIPAWMISGALGLLFIGSMQGLASGLAVGLADALWKAGSPRYLIGALAGIIYGLLLILFTSVDTIKPPTNSAFYNTIYLIYSIMLGAAIAFAIPRLQTRPGLKHRLTRALIAAVLAVGITSIEVFMVYLQEAPKLLFSRSMIAAALCFGVTLLVEPKTEE